MNDEELFLMIEDCVDFAKDSLIQDKPLAPFAMVIHQDGNVKSIPHTSEDDFSGYEQLLEILRKNADSYKAISLVSHVTIPENFNPEVSSGIRLHIEYQGFLEESGQDINKLSARLLYVPYQLYKGTDSDELHIHLYNPIPVAFPPEIFTQKR